ncbi:MAG: hypothetical protein WD065_03160 [Planctomycetaceae bacterium]
MNRIPLFCLCAILAGFSLAAGKAHAEDWMFRRSYYSHVVPGERPNPADVPEIRSAYRRAYVNTQPGFAVRGVYRINRINVWSGNSNDTTYVREGWFNERP